MVVFIEELRILILDNLINDTLKRTFFKVVSSSLCGIEKMDCTRLSHQSICFDIHKLGEIQARTNSSTLLYTVNGVHSNKFQNPG
jgi:hypothetical protein